MGEKKPALTNHQVLAVAVQAEADPKSVRRFIDGKPMRALTAQRIRRAMVMLGHSIDGGQARR